MNGLDSKSSEGFKSSSVGSNPTLSATPRLPGRGRMALMRLVISLVLFLTVGSGPALAGPIRLGIGTPVEEQLLGHLTEALLKAKGIEVEVYSQLDPEVLRARALVDELDLFWDYNGRALIVFHQDPDRAVLRDPQGCYQAVSEKDLKKGLVWGRMAPGNNSYGLVMTTVLAEQYGVTTISDLAAKMQELYKTTKRKTVMGMERNFNLRPDGFNSLLARYEMEFNSIMAKTTTSGSILDVLRTKEAQVVVGPTVDGRIRRFKLTVLQEDKPFFPSYHPAPVWRQDARKENGAAAALLDRLAEKLDIDALNDLRFPVEIHAHDPAVTAREWLRKSGLTD